MILQWFASATVRQAVALRRHVQKIVNHQRDILAPQATGAVVAAIADLDKTLSEKAEKAAIEKQMESLGKTADKWLKPYPNAAWRENVEVLLVALTVAMGIRTFFLQPFKIPTGSMQPTLYGVTSTPDYYGRGPGAEFDRFEIPTGLKRVQEWFEGVSYLHVVAEEDGELQAVEAPFRILIFNIFQRIVVGNHTYTIWFPPDYGSPTLDQRAGLTRNQFFHKGDEVVRMRIKAGDHLFVDRLTYNFRPPERGEIIVFETRGIPESYRYLHHIPGDQFYIKRLVGLSGEQLQIGDDRHLIIDGKRLDASTPHFQNVYGFNPKQPPMESRYSGHVNQKVVKEYYPNLFGNFAPLFPDQSTKYSIEPGNYMVMGDNTMNSLDSRFWGAFPANYVIGKSFFVYWPISDRFGWGYYR